jgi:type II secretory pathway predicted ATPase ExeA
MNLRPLVERADRPFAASPQVARYFPAASIEDSRRRLARAIERGDGPGVAIGAAGIGKSLLLQVLAAQYRGRFDVVMLACAQLCTRRALLQAIHFELGLDYRRRDEGELRLSLLDTLLSGDDATEGLLLLVDEAQALAVHLLEELRLLTNLARGGTPRVRLVIAGLPALEEKLASPELQSFSQRVAARCYLAPLTRAETAQYVRAQLAASQVEADRLFAPPTFDSIYTATDGVPRLVNQLCDRALVLAAANGLEAIDAAAIQAAWADLQQLPSSWEPPAAAVAPASSSASGVIEFGALSEASPVVPDEATELDEEEEAEATCVAAPEPVAPVEPEPAPIADRGLRIADYQQPQSSSLNPKSAIRNRKSPAPPAVDPFSESFEEEELVLESFLTLASIFGTRTPRVENGREPAISRLVQDALDATATSVPKGTKKPIPMQARDATERDPTPPPPLRLAVMPDSPPTADAVIATTQDEEEEAILVIEDEPSEPLRPEPGVRRESYRRLFTRLRHGT